MAVTASNSLNKTIHEIVDRVVAVAQPEKIILFGSQARGDAEADSDFDLLVIKSGDYGKNRLTGAIHRGLHGIDASVDVVVVRPEEVARYRECPYTVIFPALREGRVVYGA